MNDVQKNPSEKDKCKTIDEIVEYTQMVTGLPIDTFFYHYMLIHFNEQVLNILKNESFVPSKHDLGIMIAASYNMIMTPTNKWIVEAYKNRKT